MRKLVEVKIHSIEPATLRKRVGLPIIQEKAGIYISGFASQKDFSIPFVVFLPSIPEDGLTQEESISFNATALLDNPTYYENWNDIRRFFVNAVFFQIRNTSGISAPIPKR